MLAETNWPRPVRVGMGVTNRDGGQSKGRFESLNLGLHVGDNATLVTKNRSLVADHFAFKNSPIWLDQVHGDKVLVLDEDALHESNLDKGLPKADAIYTKLLNTPLAIMTADCLPILVCDAKGSEIAAIHAGWRGLASGIIEKTLRHFSSTNLLVYLGPAIAVCHYEVDGEFRLNFPNSTAFRPGRDKGHWMFDLYDEASRQFNQLGIDKLSASGLCTHCEESLFSFRRDGKTGRFASYIWLT